MAPKLQIALDTFDLPGALGPLQKAAPHVDIVECGTILVLCEGYRAVRAIRALFPDKQILLGTDSGKASYQKAYGSVSGIDYDPAVFCPRLIKDEGVDPAYVQDLLVGNAAAFFAWDPVKA